MLSDIEEPLRYSEIDLSNIIYTKTKKSVLDNQINKKIILVKYQVGDSNKNMVFQTPELTCVSKTRNEQNINEMEISFENKNSKVTEFIKFLTDLENKVKKDADTFAPQWFENISTDNNVVNFQKIIRTNPKYPDGLLKMKLVNNSDFVTQILNEDNRKISFENMKINSNCKLLVEVYSIWIQKSSHSYDFGIYLRPILIKFIKDYVYNYKLMDNSDSDLDDVPDTEVNPVREVTPVKEVNSVKEVFDSIFMKLRQENLEMPPLESIYQTDNLQIDTKEKSFMSVLTELNPELLSKNYSETSEENVFIKDTMTIKVISSDESSEIEQTSET